MNEVAPQPDPQPDSDGAKSEAKAASEKRIAPDRSVLFLRFSIFLTILVVGLALDLGTKSWIFHRIGLPGEYLFETEPEAEAVWWVVDDVFGFQTSLNQGALFGMGQGNVPVFAFFSFVAITGILVWLLFFRGLHSLFLTIVTGMISAGILGNLYDRLGLHRLRWNYADKYHEIGEPVYAVRDWILVMIGTRPWPNFNIADSLLVCGAILLALFAFFSKEDVF